MTTENDLLNQLAALHPSFELPVFIPGSNGEQIVSDPVTGQNAVLMSKIPGIHHDFADMQGQRASGLALAELQILLAHLFPSLPATRNPSYTEWNFFHPCVTNAADLPNRLQIRPKLRDRLFKFSEGLSAAMSEVHAGLPKQVIHGDYTNGNRLIYRDKVSGILDFEFHCYDARALDPAVALGGGRRRFGRREKKAGWQLRRSCEVTWSASF